MRPTTSIAALLALGLAACGDPMSPTDDAGVAEDAPTAPGDDAAATSDAPMEVGPGMRTIGPAERPARLVIPPQHDGETALPIVILLHGYGASGTLQDAYFGASRFARELGFYLVLPDGTLDSGERRFWNAGACCDFGGVDVDDVAYLTGLLDEAESLVNVDASRVYFVGHSNGGFMSYRMACELSDRITAVASLAGTEAEVVPCTPTSAVSVLHLHGTEDTTILYAGGLIGGATYLSADAEVAAWRERDTCSETSMTGPMRDFDNSVAGDETSTTTWSECGEGTIVEQWRMEGSGHIPPFGGATSPASRAMFEWLLARRAQ